MSTRPEGRTTISLNNPHGWLAFRGALHVHKEILQFQWPLKWPDANWIRERWVSAPIALLVGGLSEGADEALELSLFTSLEV